MKRAIVGTLVVAAVLGIAAVVIWHFWPQEAVNLEEYVPSEEFMPAYEAMQVDEPDYDIEETVRAMNALEMAQCQSEDFLSYLEYVAKQDFSRVAPDVLEQKKKLFPILQRLYDLQKEHEELDDVWMLMRSATSGATKFASEVNPVAVIGSMLVGDATLSTMSVGDGVEKAKIAAFDEYEKQKELKRQLEREIEAVRMSYLGYLEAYAPVYYKYMREWNMLCLKKDKAYIDLYGGRSIDAYNMTEEILKEYPTNREALLLKSLALINIASNYQPAADSTAERNQLSALSKEMNLLLGQTEEVNEFYIEAENTLDDYMSLYPSRSAPAPRRNRWWRRRPPPAPRRRRRCPGPRPGR